ncbi:MAG: tetratricopeptide repeat protein [Arenimonas sp.]|nr:tetratricopeptide repeat protein [Arenimonas sp.]
MPSDPHRIDHALALAAQGNVDEADTLLLHLARTGPDPMAAWHLGWLRLRAGDAEAALAILREFASDPMCSERAREQLVGERRNAEALALLKLAPRSTDDPRSLVATAVEKHLSGDHAGAADACRAALALAPAHAPAHNHLGRALHNLGDVAGGQAEFERAVHADPRYPEAWHNLGHSLRASQQLERTCEALEQALAISPGYRSARLNLGITRYMLDQPGPALACFEALLARHRDDAEAMVNAGLCLQQLGQATKARQRFEQALALAPDNQWAHFYLGVLQGEQGETAAAMASLQRALTLRPDDPEAWAELACLHEARGDFEKAGNALQSGLRVAPEHALLAVEMAKLERRQGNSLGAEARLRRVDPAPLSARIRQRYFQELGRVLDRNARSDQAYAAFRQANDLGGRALQLRGADASTLYRDTEAVRRWIDDGASGMDGVDDGDGDTGADLCFLAGFPRSTHARFEQVMAAHPGLSWVSARPTLEPLVATLNELPGGYPAAIARLDRSDRMALRRMYRLALARNGAKPGLPVLDAAPLRTLHVGLVQALFPKARLLLAVRHPAEVALANVMQPQGEPALRLNLLTLEGAVRLYDEIMGLWHLQQPRLQLPVIVIRHEDVEAAPGPALQALCAALDLAWSPQLLDAITDLPAGGRSAAPAGRRTSARRSRYRDPLQPHAATLDAHARRLGYQPD